GYMGPEWTYRRGAECEPMLRAIAPHVRRNGLRGEYYEVRCRECMFIIEPLRLDIVALVVIGKDQRNDVVAEQHQPKADLSLCARNGHDVVVRPSGTGAHERVACRKRKRSPNHPIYGEKITA